MSNALIGQHLPWNLWHKCQFLSQHRKVWGGWTHVEWCCFSCSGLQLWLNLILQLETEAWEVAALQEIHHSAANPGEWKTGSSHNGELCFLEQQSLRVCWEAAPIAPSGCHQGLHTTNGVFQAESFCFWILILWIWTGQGKSKHCKETSLSKL